MTRMTIAEAKDHLDDLLARAAKGEEIVITDDDGRTYKLVPSEKAPVKKRTLVGSARGKIRMADDFDEELEDFREYLA